LVASSIAVFGAPFPDVIGDDEARPVVGATDVDELDHAGLARDVDGAPVGEVVHDEVRDRRQGLEEGGIGRRGATRHIGRSSCIA